MNKKFWNYTFSVLLSAILVLLVAIFINLDTSNNSVNGKPIGANGVNQEKVCKEEYNKEMHFLYEIFQKEDDHINLFYQFTKDRKADKGIRPKVAFIIDDLGYQIEIAERILNLNFPVTISVLPYLPYSQYIVEMARNKRMTVLLHLPMEPHDSNINPGKGAIFSTMNEEEIRNKLIANFSNLPDVDGINNHMGSKVTENRDIMEIVLNEVKARGIFFVDSMTSPASAGYELCKEMGIKTAFRSVFLDNEQDLQYIRNQLYLLKEYALKNGHAIAIGHPYCNTVDVLYEAEEIFQTKGIEIVKLEDLLE